MGDETKTADATAATVSGAVSSGQAQRAAAVAPGDCVGRYTIKSLLGTGGMGQVYAATDPELGRTVALKLIHTERTSPQARLRLVREAQALARLHHPNVVAVHDIGTGDPMFIAMELVEGPTLEHWLNDGSRDWRDVVRVMADAGRGLAAAHAAGVTHRDFKPSNAIVGERVVVVDFGIARIGDEEELADRPPPNALSVELTDTGAVVGTVAYMAPEQTHGGAITHATDQYAFCLTLWEGLYGTRPSAERRRPGSTTVPVRVHAIVERGLAKDPAERWPDMRSLVAALDRTVARRARITAVLAAALVVVAVGSIVGWRVLHGRTERRITAEQLGRQAEQIRGQMRAARMLPAHDIVAERTKLRAQMTEIEHEMSELGDAAVGPGEFALGAAWFSLGRNREWRAEARKHLQKAWDAGERRPELAFELGYCLEGEYELEIQNAPAVEGAEREKLLDDLHKRLRDPAIAYLRQATGIDTTGEYIEGMIAQTEGRYADAVTRGEAALRAQPTLYEAGLLAANALSHVTMVAQQKGDSASTTEQQMFALFDQIVDVARSDEFVYRTYSRAASAVAAREDNNGKDITALLDRVEVLTAAGAKSDSEATWPDTTHARTLDLYAVNDDHHQRDPHAHLEAAITAAERAVAKDPKQLEASLALGDAYGYMVDLWYTPHGLDPREPLEKSIAAYKAALAIAPDPDVAGNLAITYSGLAHWQWGHGLDPSAAIDAAVKSEDDAYRMLPMDTPSAHPSVCQLYGEHALALLEHGRDATAELARAKPYCDMALAETPGQEPTRRNYATYEQAEGLAAALAGKDPRPAWQRSEAELKKAIELAPKRHGHAQLAELWTTRAAHDHRDWSGALAEAKAGLAIDPDDEEANRMMMAIAVIAARGGDKSLLDSGASVATAMIKHNADDARIWIAAGEISLLQGKSDEALASATKALALDPHHARAMLLKAAATNDAKLKADALVEGPLLATDPLAR